MTAEVVTPSPGTRLVRFGGDLDAVGAPVMAEVFKQKTRPAQAIAVDLTAVSLLSAAAAGVLYEVGSVADAAGGRLAIAAPPGGVGLALSVCRQAPGTSVVDSLPALLAAVGVADDLPAAAAIDVIGMRNRVFIAQALAVLRYRYGLADADSAFALLCGTSQRHNVSVRTLAGAVLALRPPAGTRWFPGRTSTCAPALSFRPHASTPSAVFTAALDAIACPRGDIHGVDPFHGGLVLEHHRGVPGHATAEADGGTAGALAHRTGREIVVDDVATDPRLACDARAELLATGVRAVRSIPLLAQNRDSLGTLSLYHWEPHAPPLPPGATALLAETSRWLDWYRRTIVFGALEHLHQQAAGKHRATRRDRH
jgi:anti-anti-sigma regulatory factor